MDVEQCVERMPVGVPVIWGSSAEDGQALLSAVPCRWMTYIMDGADQWDRSTE